MCNRQIHCDHSHEEEQHEERVSVHKHELSVHVDDNFDDEDDEKLSEHHTVGTGTLRFIH